MLLFIPPAQTAPAAPALADQQKSLDEAQALLTANMQGGFSYNSKSTYLHAVQHQPGLLKAWDLTEGDVWAPDLMRRRNEIRMELAWRLMDSQKMESIFPSILALHGHMDIREAVHAFFIAAHLGQWKLMQAIGKGLEATGGSIEGFHQSALNDLSTFDYAAMLRLADKTPDLPLSFELSDVEWRIQNLKVKVNKINIANPRFKSIADQMYAMSKRGSKDGWVDRGTSNVDLLQVGAAVHWVEGGGPIPVSGFISNDRLLMKGYLQNDTPGDSGLQIQTYDMHPVGGHPQAWVGTCLMEIMVPGKNAQLEEALSILWDYQWRLVPSEAATGVVQKP